MATEHLVQGSVMIEPRVIETVPKIKVSWPGHCEVIDLIEPKSIAFSYMAYEHGWLSVEFCNKNYQECSGDQDMAVIIESIEFFGIHDPRFVWQGLYRPTYPEPWISQQPQAPDPVLRFNNYLGWNGIWRLDHDLPIFTWIHQIQDLGWIYR